MLDKINRSTDKVTTKSCLVKIEELMKSLPKLIEGFDSKNCKRISKKSIELDGKKGDLIISHFSPIGKADGNRCDLRVFEYKSKNSGNIKDGNPDIIEVFANKQEILLVRYDIINYDCVSGDVYIEIEEGIKTKLGKLDAIGTVNSKNTKDIDKSDINENKVNTIGNGSSFYSDEEQEKMINSVINGDISGTWIGVGLSYKNMSNTINNVVSEESLEESEKIGDLIKIYEDSELEDEALEKAGYYDGGEDGETVVFPPEQKFHFSVKSELDYFNNNKIAVITFAIGSHDNLGHHNMSAVIDNLNIKLSEKFGNNTKIDLPELQECRFELLSDTNIDSDTIDKLGKFFKDLGFLYFEEDEEDLYDED